MGGHLKKMNDIILLVLLLKLVKIFHWDKGWKCEMARFEPFLKTFKKQYFEKIVFRIQSMHNNVRACLFRTSEWYTVRSWMPDWTMKDHETLKQTKTESFYCRKFSNNFWLCSLWCDLFFMNSSHSGISISAFVIICRIFI